MWIVGLMWTRKRIQATCQNTTRRPRQSAYNADDTVSCCFATQVLSAPGPPASSVGQLAQTMRDRSMRDLVGEVESIARQQPVAFFGAAVLAGFALSRFVKSSAEGLAASTASAPTRSSPAPTATSTGTVGGSVTPAAAPRQADMSGEQGI